MSARRATSETTAPGTKLSATIARFCSSLQRRRRSIPLITSTRAMAPSLAPVQTLSFALVLSPPASIPQGGPHRTGTALARRSRLFAGSDREGERAAAIYSLIIIAKLNGIDPRAGLADVLR